MDTQKYTDSMNKIKLLATLFFGIVIGYAIASLSAPNALQKSSLALDNKAPVVNKSTITAKQNQVGNKIKAAQPSDFMTQNSEATRSEIAETKSTNEQTLAYKYEQLKSAQLASENKIAALKRQLDEWDDSDITIEQMEALVVAPFKGYMTNFTGSKRDEIYDFHQAEDDVDWGYNMQNYISDFIVTHNNSNEITLVSALCKQQKCELLVLQHNDGGWDKIVRDLRQQSWWQFGSTHASSSNYPGSADDIAIYIFLAV
jgi:hypothetical protein